MDRLKQLTVVEYTAEDLNVPQIVHLKHRQKIEKRIKRKARRKMKKELDRELKMCYNIGTVKEREIENDY